MKMLQWIAMVAIVIGCMAPENIAGAPASKDEPRQALQHVAIGDPSCTPADCYCTGSLAGAGHCDGVILSSSTVQAEERAATWGTAVTGPFSAGTSTTIYERGVDTNSGKTTLRVWLEGLYSHWRSYCQPSYPSLPSMSAYCWVRERYEFPTQNDLILITVEGDMGSGATPSFVVSDHNNAQVTTWLTRWEYPSYYGASKNAHQAVVTPYYVSGIGQTLSAVWPQASLPSDTLDDTLPSWQAY